MMRRPRTMSRLWLRLVLMAVASAVVGCGGPRPEGGGPATGNPADKAHAADAASAPEQLITGFAASPEINKSFALINQAARSETVALRTAALAHLRDANPDVHYAALYALALTADADHGARELAVLLSSPLADDRLLAAGALAGLRDKRALPVLIAALDDPRILSYRDPPEPAFEFAKTELLWFTRQEFVLKGAATAEQIGATKPAWENWWRTAGASIHFDPQTRRFAE